MISRYEQNEVVKFYEKQLLNRVIQTDSYINAIYRNFIKSTSEILAKYRANSMGVVIKNAEYSRQLQAEIDKLTKNLETAIQSNQQYAWQLADTKNDDLIRRFTKNLPISTIQREGLFIRNEEAFTEFAKRKINGMNLSDRVWNLKQSSKEILENYLETGISVGRSAGSISRDIRQALNEPDKLFRRVRDKQTGKLKLSKAAREYHPGQGVYRSSYKNARRLAATETTMAYRASDHERWKATDWILGFEVRLSNNHTLNGVPFVDICDSMVGKYPKTFKFVGWHPLCRCVSTPILPNDDDFLDFITGEPTNLDYVNNVPDGFNSWVSANGEKLQNWKTQPFFVRDNFKGGRIENGLKIMKK